MTALTFIGKHFVIMVLILIHSSHLALFSKLIKEKGKFSLDTPNVQSSVTVGVRHTEIVNYRFISFAGL